MARDLDDMQVRLKQHKNGLEQLAMKQKYQAKQLAQRKANGASPATSSVGFNKTQTEQLKTILKQE